MRNRLILLYGFMLVFFYSCAASGKPGDTVPPDEVLVSLSDAKTIHVMVALCDNRYQGIVPVPAGIGNGQDAEHNLYWGCAFGIRTYFSKSKDWVLITKYKINDTILERAIFRNRSNGYYLIADAFNGKSIKECTVKLLESCAGSYSDTVQADGKILGIGAYARLRAYIGHDGLMDFGLNKDVVSVDNKKRDLIVLACYSKRFFSEHATKAAANPLLWSTGLMSPEAYTLHDALTAYMNGEPPANIRLNAANAYARYQRCSRKSALNLLVTGY